MFFFKEEVMSLARELRSRNNEHNSVNVVISAFITTGQPMITNPITEVNDPMQETSPVLLAFKLCNLHAVFKDVKSRKEYFQILTNYSGQTKTGYHENNTITAIPILNEVQAEVKYKDFMEEFDRDAVILIDKVKEDVKMLVTAKILTSHKVENCIQSNKPLSIDIYKFLAKDRT